MVRKMSDWMPGGREEGRVNWSEGWRVKGVFGWNVGRQKGESRKHVLNESLKREKEEILFWQNLVQWALQYKTTKTFKFETPISCHARLETVLSIGITVGKIAILVTWLGFWGRGRLKKKNSCWLGIFIGGIPTPLTKVHRL